VDKEHNEPGTPFLSPDPIREAAMQQNMREPATHLTAPQHNATLRR